jgi:hypothetical protein
MDHTGCPQLALRSKMTHEKMPTVKSANPLRAGGMIALEDIAAGEVLLSEHPFLISSTGVEHRWADRWRAYLTMMGGKGMRRGGVGWGDEGVPPFFRSTIFGDVHFSDTRRSY